MKILLVKTSSMGDVIHALPALTDAARAIPGIKFDWLVEEAFAEIPTWHPAVERVIPVAFRRLRKNKFFFWSAQWRQFKQHLRAEHYDLIIDAQGLLKSAYLARLATGKRVGYDRHSAREGLAAFFYHKTIAVSRQAHAITRVRQLFAQALHYTVDLNAVDYGLNTAKIPLPDLTLPKNYSVFIANTSWQSKLWPTEYWRELLEKMQQAQQPVVIPAGYITEQAMIQKIVAGFNNVRMLPELNLTQLCKVIAHSQTIVSVDTGLAHLAAALDKPTIVLYGPTNPGRIGTLGKHQVHLQANFPCAPCRQKHCSYLSPSPVKPACYTTVTSQHVWQTLQPLLNVHE